MLYNIVSYYIILYCIGILCYLAARRGPAAEREGLPRPAADDARRGAEACYMYMYTYLHIYIYICIHIYTHVYNIYIYIHIYIHLFIILVCIYIYRERERKRERKREREREIRRIYINSYKSLSPSLSIYICMDIIYLYICMTSKNID